MSHPGFRGLTWEGLAEHRLSGTWLPRISKTRKELSVSGISHLCCKVALKNTLMGAPAPTGSLQDAVREQGSPWPSGLTLCGSHCWEADD